MHNIRDMRTHIGWYTCRGVGLSEIITLKTSPYKLLQYYRGITT